MVALLRQRFHIRRVTVVADRGMISRGTITMLIEVSWPDLMRDLGQVQSVLVELDGQRYQLRTDMVGSAHHAFAAAGVRPPSAVTPLGPVS